MGKRSSHCLRHGYVGGRFGNGCGWHDFWNNQIPFVGGFISLFELLFKPGDRHRNSFGKPPIL